ncbi:hypothetical protein [Paraburkholderia rhizosphaerae]|uniref:Uncharacterized protein n=1 Tax=Paraburkholderia rhizosphaerae TaxID=480658 RepID=A0A4R8LPC4_9BURK|nr:hypothetical protein [Paraburkholderia rhizosphaerae]TDY46404.1 hypothetical protein BX592_11327 [Paraburkholderia rhizosphaerae]
MQKIDRNQLSKSTIAGGGNKGNTTTVLMLNNGPTLVPSCPKASS